MRLGAACRRRADDGGQPRHPRGAGGLRPARVHQPPGRHGPVGPAAPDTARPEPYGIRLWCLGNEMDGPWQIGPQDRRRVRPARRGDRQGDAPGRPRHRARRLRQLQQPDADLRRVGGDGARARLRRRRLHLACTPTTRSATATSPASSPRRSTWTASSDSVVATADHVGRQAPAAASGSTSPSTSGTSGTSSEFAGHTNLELQQTPAPDRGHLHGRRRRRGRRLADHACCGTPTGSRSPAWPSSSTSSRRSAPSRAGRPGGRRSSTRSR